MYFQLYGHHSFDLVCSIEKSGFQSYGYQMTCFILRKNPFVPNAQVCEVWLTNCFSFDVCFIGGGGFRIKSPYVEVFCLREVIPIFYRVHIRVIVGSRKVDVYRSDVARVHVCTAIYAKTQPIKLSRIHMVCADANGRAYPHIGVVIFVTTFNDLTNAHGFLRFCHIPSECPQQQFRVLGVFPVYFLARTRQIG